MAGVSDDELYRQYETVNLYRRGPGAKVELNRPERMNAWSNQFSLDLLAAIREVTDDPGVRAVLVTAGVNGPAAGIGLSLALACDLVVAAESAYFSLAFVNIGLVPDGGSSVLVPSRVGFARAAELAMLGERLDARKALNWGLINRVWPDEEYPSQAEALLDRLASGATKSYAGTKRQLNQWLYERMDAQLEFEAQIQREMAASGDFAEGLAAFAEKRPPRFSGA